MRPVVAVYSSFLQRGYDQLIHDCSIHPRHIVLGVDRAGLVGEDGETHQGVFDCAFLSAIPGAEIYSPATYAQLELCLNEAIFDGSGLCAVRYPRGSRPDIMEYYDSPSIDPFYIDGGNRDILLVTYGRIYGEVSLAHNNLTSSRADVPSGVSLLKLTRVWPPEQAALDIAAGYKHIIFIEEGIRSGGIGEHFLSRLVTGGYKGGFTIRAIEDRFVPPGSVRQQMKLLGLDAEAIQCTIHDAQRTIKPS